MRLSKSNTWWSKWKLRTSLNYALNPPIYNKTKLLIFPSKILSNLIRWKRSKVVCVSCIYHWTLCTLNICWNPHSSINLYFRLIKYYEKFDIGCELNPPRHNILSPHLLNVLHLSTLSLTQRGSIIRWQFWVVT